jgi:hypothetical protein
MDSAKDIHKEMLPIWAAFLYLRDWCIWLVDLFECMMMHGLTNPKQLKVVNFTENLTLNRTQNSHNIKSVAKVDIPTLIYFLTTVTLLKVLCCFFRQTLCSKCYESVLNGGCRENTLK